MTHLIKEDASPFGFIKGLIFGFTSVCGSKNKGDGLWDSTRANCPKCLKKQKKQGKNI